MSSFARWCAVTLITLSVATALTAGGSPTLTAVTVTSADLIAIGSPLQESRDVIEAARTGHRTRAAHHSPPPFIAARLVAAVVTAIDVEAIAWRSGATQQRLGARTHDATGPPACS
jgi:hypothetical protein